MKSSRSIHPIQRHGRLEEQQVGDTTIREICKPISHSTSSLPFILSRSASLTHPALCFGRQASTVTVGSSPRAFASLRRLLTSLSGSLLGVLATQMTRMVSRPIATIYGSSRTMYCLSSIIRLNFPLCSWPMVVELRLFRPVSFKISNNLLAVEASKVYSLSYTVETNSAHLLPFQV